MGTFELDLAGCRLNVRPRFSETETLFRKAYPPCRPDSREPGPHPSASPLPPVSVPPEDWPLAYAQGLEDCAHTEYSLLTAYCSDALLPFGRMVMHGVAIRWRGSAWLICGPSGVGKSTQARFLRELRPGEFDVICGDRPILEFRPARSGAQSAPQDAEILVHPSPWNGKENWYGAPAAPLAGLILLERGDENRVYSVSEAEAAIPFYLQVIQTSRFPANIRIAAGLVSRMLQAVPIWKLVSRDVPDSTRLLLEEIF